ncbi:MAG: (2Fe-2S)-binding protein [Candidatus Lokiarchaeota archaeon]|nr:(2Fe-2S)-binding protein [Candidatus Lokiarchaeota archaeon]
MIKINIDNKNIGVEKGRILLDVLKENEFMIPTLCYHKNLSLYGSCRLCTVEIIKEGRSSFVTSCNYPIKGEMVVKTNSNEVIKIRKMLIELMLARCPNVKYIKELAKKMGVEKTRFPLQHENCLLCGLCVRVCDEIVGAHAINFSDRGLDKKVTTLFNMETDLCINCNECVKVCPTGEVEFLVKKYSKTPDRIASGHRLCAGCAESIIIRQVLHATNNPVIISNATGCTEVATTIYPYTSWKIPWIHSAFENAASTISGVEACYRVLKRTGRIKDDEIKFLAFGGDGGTYDIGLQALSGAVERGHDFLYICFNNEAYMNTGIQRSSATSKGASTTTSPAGIVIPGKKEFPKDLTEIMVAHRIPYVAQTSPGLYNDLIAKVGKAFNIKGPKFINVISPCPRGWRFDPEKTIELSKLAVKTCFWPTYEVKNNKYRITGLSKLIADGKQEKIQIEEYLKMQGRFKHLFSEKFKSIILEIQERIDLQWNQLKAKCGY